MGESALRRRLASAIDHTLLKPEATVDDVRRLCDEAVAYGFAAVCVAPIFVSLAAERLAGKGPRVATVIGFPTGAVTSQVKALETRDALAAGADEFDMVIPVGRLRAGEADAVLRDIAGVVEAAAGRMVKVILETALLSDAEKRAGCALAAQAGAHYVKTSTGFGPGGATVDDVRLLRQATPSHMGVKASGGIRDRETVLRMLDAGATRIGTSQGVSLIADLS